MFITDELANRVSPPPDYLREKLAVHELARHMSGPPDAVMTHLVELARDICAAQSAGISILEEDTDQFRWFGLSGTLAVFEGATTPRNFSPCGVCLDVGGPILMARPELAYDWIRDADITVPEVLLVPLKIENGAQIGTLWIVSETPGHFHQGHARIMTELAAFAGLALRMVQGEQRLQAALAKQEMLTHEMSHRVKNFFAIAEGLVRMTARAASTKDELETNLSGRFRALSVANALVRRSFGDDQAQGVTFDELIQRILLPYHNEAPVPHGPTLVVGERAINDLALIFHEMATNAVKYGALSQDSGKISIDWSADDHLVRVVWNETGGPAVGEPASTGFGMRLLQATITSLGGTISYDWQPEGLSATLTLQRAALR
ncbi:MULTISPECIES: sensor histidine kinase [unclassified Bradyrhizobium]|uniref:sensor histidine kinase n=1 Tax=unclassified Bradyrhizobium TaxID=2631580 RepID=UPI0028E825A3|nr:MULTISPECIES: HWE histidine kinase domain-containing protein [unclassified Bradyrhizobium]